MDSLPIFLFRRVCLERELCFGLNCQSGDKQERGLVELLNKKLLDSIFKTTFASGFLNIDHLKKDFLQKVQALNQGPLN